MGQLDSHHPAPHVIIKTNLHLNLLITLLRELDLNQRPLGYEPSELPTALSRDIKTTTIFTNHCGKL